MRNKKFLIKLIVSSVVLLIIPIIVFGYLSYFNISQNALKLDEEYTLKTLCHAVKSSDLFLKEMDSIIIHSTFNDDINQITDSDYLKSEYNKSQSIARIENFVNTNDKISFIHVSDMNKIIVSSYFGFQNYNFEWLSFLKENDTFWTDWKPRILNIDSYETKGSNEINVITKCARLKNGKGFFVMDINIETLYEIMEDYLGNSPYIFIVNSEGRLIRAAVKNKGISAESWEAEIPGLWEKIYSKANMSYKGNRLFTMNNKQYSISFAQSSYNNWLYIKATPLEVLYSRANNIRKLTFVWALLCILIGFLVSFIVSSRVYRPVKTLFNTIALTFMDKTGAKDEIGYIHDAVETLIKENNDISQKLKNNYVLVREKLISEVLEGRSENYLDIYNEFLVNVFTGPCFLVYTVSFDITKFHDLNTKLGSIKEFCAKDSNFYNIELLLHQDRIAFILQGKHDVFEREGITDYLSYQIEFFNEKLDLNCTIGVGNPVKGYINIRQSYKNSLKALEYKLVTGNNKIIFYDDYKIIPQSKSIELLSKQLDEEFILKCIREKDSKAIKNNFMEIVNSFIKNSSFNKNCIIMVYRQYIIVILKYIFTNNLNINIDMNFSNVIDISTLDDMKEVVGKLADSVVSHLSSSDNQQVINYIAEYIEKNYFNDISLDSLAEKVYMSKSHLSRLFKQYYGVNFKTYLIKVRMEMAEKMLLTTNFQTQTIARKIGYNNFASFSKTFKNYEGISPNEYRKKYCLENLCG